MVAGAGRRRGQRVAMRRGKGPPAGSLFPKKTTKITEKKKKGEKRRAAPRERERRGEGKFPSPENGGGRRSYKEGSASGR